MRPMEKAGVKMHVSRRLPQARSAKRGEYGAWPESPDIAESKNLRRRVSGGGFVERVRGRLLRRDDWLGGVNGLGGRVLHGVGRFLAGVLDRVFRALGFVFLGCDALRGHRVFDGHLGADFEFAGDFGVRTARDFKALLAFHHDDFRVRDFDDRTGDLIGVRARGKRGGAEAEGGGEGEEECFVHRIGLWR